MARLKEWAHYPWGRILRRAAAESRRDKVSMVASGVAFRATLAIFPAVAVLVWVGAQLLGAAEVQSAVRSVFSGLPESTRAIVERAMSSKLASDPASGHANSFPGSAAPWFGILFAVWSANSGVWALLVALNSIFERLESRGFLRRAAISMAFTAGALGMGIVVIALTVVVPYLRLLPAIPADWLAATRYLRWPMLYLLAAAGLGVLYRYAPNREGERWPLVTVGGLGAAAALVGASAIFSWLVDHFARLTVTYGSLSTVIAFMIWLWLSFALVLAGAELDAAVERETMTGTKSAS
ncbi:YihY/virulence factor BrkB family protein [Amaricoccus solimangrovi]|uniref:YihY/virulence factor BrkB family protein n=1 Tax=Amaricoccus solimangrovi TaxID=2589815 RepID=A0A501WAM5_9RHOB|nr:YihY/virulence factor BrkB family protein [Amaricoccus solimangrovi]TPE45114.1 YihY/virulence factor BrkB family protein [Amaricoccus solimangrovi]